MKNLILRGILWLTPLLFPIGFVLCCGKPLSLPSSFSLPSRSLANLNQYLTIEYISASVALGQG